VARSFVAAPGPDEERLDGDEERRAAEIPGELVGFFQNVLRDGLGELADDRNRGFRLIRTGVAGEDPDPALGVAQAADRGFELLSD